MTNDPLFESSQSLRRSLARWRAATACLAVALTVALAMAAAGRRHGHTADAGNPTTGETGGAGGGKPAPLPRFIRVPDVIVRTDLITNVIHNADTSDVDEHKLSISMEGKNDITIRGSKADQAWSELGTLVPELPGGR